MGNFLDFFLISDSKGKTEYIHPLGMLRNCAFKNMKYLRIDSMPLHVHVVVLYSQIIFCLIFDLDCRDKA